MTDGSSLNISDQIDIACDEFERGWIGDRRKPIEEFMTAELSESHRNRLLRELLLLERDLQQKNHLPVSTEANLLQRFPDAARVIADILRNTETVIPAQFPHR